MLAFFFATNFASAGAFRCEHLFPDVSRAFQNIGDFESLVARPAFRVLAEADLAKKVASQVAGIFSQDEFYLGHAKGLYLTNKEFDAPITLSMSFKLSGGTLKCTMYGIILENNHHGLSPARGMISIFAGVLKAIEQWLPDSPLPVQFVQMDAEEIVNPDIHSILGRMGYPLPAPEETSYRSLVLQVGI